MKYENNIISVITPFYNSKKYIERLVWCVQNQKKVCIEHIIINDNSNDGSTEILTEIAKKYKSIKLINSSINEGPLLARNRGLKLAVGRFVAFLDADDYWHPSKSYVQSRIMKKNQYSISFCDYRHVSENNERIGSRISGLNKIGWNLHHMTRYLGCLTIMIDRNRVKNLQFESISPSVRAEDFLAWANILKANFAYRIPYDLARYTKVSGSRSSNYRKSIISVFYLYTYVEDIGYFKARILFSIYLLFSIYKYLRYRPNKINNEKLI